MPVFILALALSLTLAGCAATGAPDAGFRGYDNTPSGGLVPGQRGF